MEEALDLSSDRILNDELKDRRGYSHMNEEAVDRTMWRNLLEEALNLSSERILNDDLKDRRGYSHMNEEAVDRTMWRNRFGGVFGPVVRQNIE